MAAVCAPSAAVAATDGLRHAASFRDPSGFIFVRDEVIYRQVQTSYREHYDRLVGSGLLGLLVREKLLIHHEESSTAPAAPGAYKVLRPAPIDVISYPYEWSFGQLKDAALLTLRIQSYALDHGLSLKDASAYNVQFQEGRPIFIDTLSFETYVADQPWCAYRQFCQHFLAPLALMARVDIRLGQLTRVHLDGVPLDLASRLLPHRSWMRPGLTMHIHAHAAALRKYSNGSPSGERRASASVSRRGLGGILESLQRTIAALEWKPSGTEWADYEATHRYGQAALESKRELVKTWVSALSPAPARIVDLGSNAGAFSRLLASGPERSALPAKGALVVSVDGDPAAAEVNYRRTVAAQETQILPLVADLTNCGSGAGWDGDERSPLFDRVQADLAVCLALVHHLAIGHNVPFERIAPWLARVAPRLVIEFVPKQDEQTRRLLAGRTDVFDDYTAAAFERSFTRHFAIERRQAIAGSDRTLYQMRRLREPA
jgi:ribosomal protein L11 methylase PrmA